jgi:ABC-type methionine transport system ATPase subunit
VEVLLSSAATTEQIVIIDECRLVVAGSEVVGIIAQSSALTGKKVLIRRCNVLGGIWGCY